MCPHSLSTPMLIHQECGRMLLGVHTGKLVMKLKRHFIVILVFIDFFVMF